MIISGGFNIYPSDLEAVLRGHPAVADAPWSACRRRAGARRRWPSWCCAEAPAQPTKPCASGPTPRSARHSACRDAAPARRTAAQRDRQGAQARAARALENKAGANGTIGVADLARSAPDGYSFVIVIAAHAANPSLYAKLPYDNRNDLAAVSLIGVSPLVAAVNNDAPFKNAKELVAYAKQNPGKVSFGSSGNGAAAHLTTELLKTLTQTDMVHIPYKGAAAALQDLMGGQIQLLFDAASGLINPGKAGQVRLIGVAAERRLPMRPLCVGLNYA
jgi:tripartite-type tricarboxylate transporter receptor subunit TctC